MIKLRNRNIAGGLIKGLSVILLLVLYCLATLRIDSVHRLFGHHEDATLHTPEEEEAPCHIAIYHQERSDGCEHKAHFSENDKCSLCDSQVHPTHIFFTNDFRINYFSCSSDLTSIQDSGSNGFLSYSSSRAPPNL